MKLYLMPNYSAMEKEPMYYSTYLHLDKIIESQYPVSFEPGNEPAHDDHSQARCRRDLDRIHRRGVRPVRLQFLSSIHRER